MAEEITKSISEEKGDVLKPNFEVEDLKKIVEENAELEKLKKFIEGDSVAVKTKKSIAIKDKGKDKEKTKDKEIRIDINEFNEFDYLNFTLILTAINVGDEMIQIHSRTQSVFPVIKKKKESDIQELLNALFDKYCTTYNLKEINNYIESGKLHKESKIEKESLEEEYKKVKEDLENLEKNKNNAQVSVILLTLLEIIDRFNMGFGWSKTDFKNFIGLRVITNFNKTYFNNIEENFKRRCLDLMIQILKDCLSNVYKLKKEEFLNFLEFIIDNFDFINNSDYIEHFSDIHNLTSSIFNYFLNVNDCNDEFTENFIKKLKKILLKIKKPKINFGDILSRLNACKEDVDKVKFILPFLIYMNILSLDENKKNYIIDLLIKDGNIIYLKSIYEKCCEIEIEQIKDQRYEKFYEEEFDKFKENIIKKYAGDIIDFINCAFIFKFIDDLKEFGKFFEKFWSSTRTSDDISFPTEFPKRFHDVEFNKFLKYIDFPDVYNLCNNGCSVIEKNFDNLSDTYKKVFNLIKEGEENTKIKETLLALKNVIEKKINEGYQISEKISEILNLNYRGKELKEEYERLKQEIEGLKQEIEGLKKAKEEENTKEIKIEEKEKIEIKSKENESKEIYTPSSFMCVSSSYNIGKIKTTIPEKKSFALVGAGLFNSSTINDISTKDTVEEIKTPWGPLVSKNQKLSVARFISEKSNQQDQGK